MSDAPYGYDEPQPPAGPNPAVKGRVMAPAIFLIIVGALNLLWALFELGDGVFSLTRSPAELHDQQIKTSEAMIDAFVQDADTKEKLKDQIESQAGDPQTEYAKAVGGTFAGALFWLIASIVTLFGAWRMMALKSYGLAVTGAIVAAIPCVSCPGGCCFIGQIAGIWALIVLLNTDVRSAFR